MDKKVVVVGTKPAPPFSFKNENGVWTGISIDLWRHIANDLNLQYDLKEYDLKGLLNAVENKSVDFGVAAITITPARENVFDFSHAFYHTGLGIAVPVKMQSNPILTIAKQVISLQFLGYLITLIITLLCVGFLLWLAERRKNPDEVRSGFKGILDGFWWSAVTMTTVGYGDTVPKSGFGRLIALIWMFMAIIIISFFTAGIASSLTVSQLDSGVKSFEDLYDVVVGSLEKSTTTKYLQNKNIRPKTFSSVLDGLQALADGKIDAMVHDRPILQFYANSELKGKVTVIKALFNPQSYGIAMPAGTRYREIINQELLKRWTNEEYWKKLTGRYLGD
ncbi:MAG: Extracellular solute-binding protein family 3 precursor [Candidatus Magnetoglobus multicellularis str. Araruama]|uniref:Extracellular solute-binding protein family 3 n=1 Tax=Candidatus Magnetoglobus multicellularis str. Araruama TaxID=890399 RepID=A0A1V1PI86_9BACT|nr:MAG: Extracellular solute-binding protein family 3 precursor [Candidatus Magnetoglobus multicellularis str. Araruama]